MRRIIRVLLCYMLYTVLILIVGVIFSALYRYGIMHHWRVTTGFMYNTVITGLYVFLPLASCAGLIRSLFLIRRNNRLYGFQLLVLGLFNVGTLVGVYTLLNNYIPPELSKTLPYNYLLVTDDGRELVLLGDEWGIENVVVGDNRGRPYFNVYKKPQQDGVGQRIILGSSIDDIHIGDNIGPVHWLFAPPPIIAQLWQPMEALGAALHLRNSNGIISLMLFLSSITFTIVLLWHIVRTSSRYGLNLCLTLVAFWSVLKLYFWLTPLIITSETAGNFPLLQSFARIDGVIILPGIILFIIHCLSLFGGAKNNE